MMKSRIIFFSCVYVPGVHVCLLGGGCLVCVEAPD